MLQSSLCNDHRVLKNSYTLVFRECIYGVLLLRVSRRRFPGKRLARRRFVGRRLADRVIAHARGLTLWFEVCKKTEKLQDKQRLKTTGDK